MSDFFNRELSWLEFNYRVLEEALDPQKKPLERLKFLAIFSSNLDEFVMVRLSGLVSQVKLGYTAVDESGHTPMGLLEASEKRIRELLELQYRCVANEILPALSKAGIHIHGLSEKRELSAVSMEHLGSLFEKEYFAVLTPMAIDPGRPFPFLAGKQIHLLVELAKAGEERSRFAIVPIPMERRFISLPGRKRDYVTAETFVRSFVHLLFSGYEIKCAHAFRITRDGELLVTEEEAVDLLSTIEDEVKKRERGLPIRLEHEAAMNEEHLKFLREHLGIPQNFSFAIPGPLDLTGFFSLVNDPELGELCEPSWPPLPSPAFENPADSIFDSIRERDQMIWLPFEEFDPVIRLIDEASNDPQVLAIKQTLYRTSGDSPIVAALKRASHNGKQVTVLVELKARFDEARNITWAKELEKAGCYVVYGLVGMKIHAKMLLVVRREKDGIRRYVHLSTGNFNDRTAKSYTDIGLFTAKPAFGRDVSEIFNLLTGFSDPPRWRKLVTAPLDLRNFFLAKLEREIENVKKGGKGQVIAKMNAVLDERMMRALYAASQAGVKIQLVVRGICCLRPGVKDLSETISVISIVDRYLEHSRIYYFYANGEREVFLSSADWMNRNFDRRVEILFPVEEEDHRKEVMDYLQILLADNTHARDLSGDGVYLLRKTPAGEKARNAQREMYQYIQKRSGTGAEKAGIRFIPKTKSEQAG